MSHVYKILLVVASTTFGCSPLTSPDLPPGARELRAVPDELLKEYYSGISDRRRVVIRDRDTWASFWTQVMRGRSPQPVLPEVGFAAEMVIAAAMGSRASGGYSIHIDGVYESEGRVYVVVREVSPKNCFVTAAITAPVTAVRVPRHNVAVVFVERTEIHDCG